MTDVSDWSPYSVTDAMIWAALKDTSTTHGAVLDAWRRQLNPRGNRGMDFDGSDQDVKEIPETITAKHSPALLIENGVIDEADRTFGSITRLYQIEIVGLIDISKELENRADRLIKRFQHLVEMVLGEVHREFPLGSCDYLPEGLTSSPIESIDPGTPEFPNWRDPEAIPGFIFPIEIRLHLDSVWQA